MFEIDVRFKSVPNCSRYHHARKIARTIIQTTCLDYL